MANIPTSSFYGKKSVQARNLPKSSGVSARPIPSDSDDTAMESDGDNKLGDDANCFGWE